MLTSVKFTKSGEPIPLDSAGNEICLLFLKYGRCRFKKKCKKSHWTPPLPDEEYPLPPPLPPFSPSSLPYQCSSSDQQFSNQHIHILEEQQHNVLLNEANTGKENIILNTTYSEVSTEITFPNLDPLLDQNEISCRFQEQSFDATQSSNLCQDSVQEDTEPIFTSVSTSSKSLMEPCLGTDIRDQAKNAAREKKTTSNDDESMAMYGMEKVLDRTVEVIRKGGCRFDHLYHHVGQSKGCRWRFRSSLEQSYQSYGAYYDKVSQKLQFHHQPRNKVGQVKNNNKKKNTRF